MLASCWPTVVTLRRVAGGGGGGGGGGDRGDSDGQGGG